ncbi:merR HTH regulatory family protein [Bordetella holmesii 30539]|uniref:MerR HTH regulatory family protein n=1 Tax=Bordetella holmesii 1058 TaxID=1247648 RepID=A0ABN0RW01_9BORD|nr:merR HTH regulatory family protein [Bordetella holmesii ATCC 51541]AIT27392.1 merR HTH regulatory family protein [Bordetella holmesii 44057]EWM43707.1 merR HTH regulatory family protein [Bordetella holmesii 41130]EWM47982.1 merR HTH regulatory family protein [Bordetella holmesii 35009]EWM48959.1 merR HTH regulatory family protein [Bordetella holmesii 70147]EXF87428.1 merR HTH regulatory family protein [Bordetella holmesii 30539]EXX93433.1 merR HTH regulatory family protein [Bordetella holm
MLRYWEQEFTQLKPVKRRGNRRYYQHHEVLLIRRIRSLLYEQGFTISGARNRLGDTRDALHDSAEAAVRLSATELKSLRAELNDISASLSLAVNQPAAH